MMRRFNENGSRGLHLSRRGVLAAMLILAMPGCTGHDNPFDSKNARENDPFAFDAATDYGKITLKWEWPTYPVEGGQRINIDRFVLFRQAFNNSKIDTIYPQPALRMDWVDSMKTKGIIGEKIYIYRVAAWRGSSLSDSSRPKSAKAYALPLDESNFGSSEGIELGSPTAIAFDGNFKYLANTLGAHFLRLYNANDGSIRSRAISYSVSDMALARVKPDSSYLYLCSSDGGSVGVFNAATLNLMCTFMEVRLKPQAIVTPSGKPFVYVADRTENVIYKMRIGGCILDTTNMTTGDMPWKLAVFPNSRLLFCANKGAKNVSIFDLNTESRLAQTEVGLEPIDLWPGTDAKLYVACQTGGTVDIIDTTTYRNVDQIAIKHPETGELLSPISVTGFPHITGEHRGVLTVAACGKNACYLLYYSLDDKIARGWIKLPGYPIVARMNLEEKPPRLYVLWSSSSGSGKIKVYTLR